MLDPTPCIFLCTKSQTPSLCYIQFVVCIIKSSLPLVFFDIRKNAIAMLYSMSKSRSNLHHNHAKLPKATTPMASAAAIIPVALVVFPAAELAVNSAVLTLVRPVAVIPFNLSAVSILGPTLKKSTKKNVGLIPHSLSHCCPCNPKAPVVFVSGEFVVVIFPTSGVLKNAWSWYLK